MLIKEITPDPVPRSFGLVLTEGEMQVLVHALGRLSSGKAPGSYEIYCALADALEGRTTSK